MKETSNFAAVSFTKIYKIITNNKWWEKIKFIFYFLSFVWASRYLQDARARIRVATLHRLHPRSTRHRDSSAGAGQDSFGRCEGGTGGEARTGALHDSSSKLCSMRVSRPTMPWRKCKLTRTNPHCSTIKSGRWSVLSIPLACFSRTAAAIILRYWRHRRTSYRPRCRACRTNIIRWRPW